MKKFIIKGNCDINKLEDGTLEIIPKDLNSFEIGDEYHTIHELYQHRMALTAALANILYREGFNVYKSKLHHDETMFEGGYFVVFFNDCNLQFSYHYTIKHWDKFKIPEMDKCEPYDGHTSKDTIERLMKL